MKTNKYFSMTALAIVIVGAIITSCSSDNNNNEIVTPPQPVNTDKVVTLKATVSMDNGVAGTRALDIDNEKNKVIKTFAAGERIAVVYKNTNGETVKATSEALTSDDIDIAGGSKSADFTVTLTNPDKTKSVTYIYPAAMAKDDGSVNYDALTTQDGTLATLASSLDYCEYTDAWSGENLPTGDLENKFAICAFTLKDALGNSEITSSITSLVLTEGSNIYTVSRSAGAGPIYVAIRPTSDKTINFLAGAGTTKTYAKYVQNKTYEAGKMYKIGLKMAEVINGKFSVSSTKQVYFSKGNLQATTTDLGNHWTWKFAEHQWDKIGGRTKNDQNVESGEYTCNNYITGTNKPTVSANGTVDLFGWSTSTTYLGISSYNDNANYSGDFVDWGSHADVIASIGTGWRTLSDTESGGAVGEWDYILNRRSTPSGIRYAKAQVNNVFGLIILPDDWSTSYYTLNYTNENGKSVGFASCNNITLKDWNDKLEAHGAVFLPVAGQRRTDNHFVDYPNGRLYYWSSTLHDAGTAYRVYFAGNEFSYSVNSSRRFGYAVRLVYPIK